MFDFNRKKRFASSRSARIALGTKYMPTYRQCKLVVETSALFSTFRDQTEHSEGINDLT